MTVSSTPLPLAAPSVEQALQQAVRQHQAGHLQEAEELYRTVLQTQPAHPDANHNMGVLEVQRGQPAAGLPYFETALRACPEQAHHWLSYIETLIQTGQKEAARQVLALGRQHGLQGVAVEALAGQLTTPARDGAPISVTPQDRNGAPAPAPSAPGGRQVEKSRSATANSSFEKGASCKADGNAPDPQQINALVALYNQGQFAEAAMLARSLTARFPEHGFGWKVLGNVLQLQGQLEEALSAMQKAAEMLPLDAEVHGAQGNIFLGLGRRPDAEASYRRALEIKPAFAEVHNNLGVVLHDLGQLENAVASCRRALEINPAFAAAHCNLGNALRDLGQFDEAVAAYRRAIEIEPDFSEAHDSLGSVLRNLGQLDDALASYRRALEIKSNYAEAHNNLGLALQAQGKLDEAIASIRQALRIKPQYVEAHGNLLFCLNYHPDLSADAIFAEYLRWNEQHARPLRQSEPHLNRRDPNRRLRIGYVSPDLRRHSACHFIEPLLARHDRRRFEIFAYAQVPLEDDVSARFKTYCDHWHNTTGMSDAQMAERIRNDGIDILIDLAGHTAGNRLLVFARKPAPIQVSWLGYGYTTGLDAIDYLLADREFAPPGSESLFSEKLVRLPRWAAYRPQQGIGETQSPPVLKTGSICFGSLSRTVRINHRVIRTWAAILQRVPGSRLIVNSGDLRSAGMQANMRERFAAYGIAAERLELGYQSPPWDVLAKIDIGLDCFPHNSGTTLFENLYLGIPFITLAERPSVGRIGAAILTAVGHPEWIAASEQEYVEKAVGLASDTGELALLRGGLRSKMEASSLMDEAALARSIEEACLTMWRRWCEGEAASGIDGAATTNMTVSGPSQPAAVPSRDRTKAARPNKSPAKESAGKVRGKTPGQSEIDALVALYRQARFGEVETLARSLTLRFPRYAFAWKLLGYALHCMGRVDEAMAAMQKAVALSPEDVESHNILGNVLLGLKQLAAAEASYRRALKIKPGYADAHNNLGNVLRELGQPDAAAASCRRAIAIRLDFAEAHCNLGNALRDLGQFDGAAASYCRAIEIKPGFPEPHNGLGATLRDLGRLDEALASCRRAVEIRPGHAEGHSNLGSVLQERGHFDAAVASYHRALEIRPDFAEVFSNLLFCLSHSEKISPATLFAEHLRFGEQFEAPLRPAWPMHANRRDPERCLRIGFVSGDLRNHAVASYIEPLLPHLAGHASLTLLAYSNYATEDAASQRLRQYFTHWNPVAGLSDAALAEKIRADGIDILIDLSGHSAKHRLLTFARKPAPLQASWIGYPGTTGLRAVDYYLVDRFFLPPGQFDAQFTEKIVHLPAGAPFLPCEAASPVNTLPALNNGHITFGSFNQPRKLSQPVIALWSQLLRALPDARMLLGAMPEDGKVDVLIDMFAAEGVTRDRLSFHPRCGMDAYLALHHQVDICLDTFPYNGGTTTLHAVWMGVPTLTLVGDAPSGRSGAAILGHAGLDGFVAHDAADFVQKGLSAADNLPALAALRAGLRERFGQSAMSQPALVAAGLERALRLMWRHWCAGLAPETFEVRRQDLGNVIVDNVMQGDKT